MRRGDRTGRARIGELVVWDAVLLLVVVGLIVAEQQVPAKAAPLQPLAPPPAATQPRSPAATEPRPQPQTEAPKPPPVRRTAPGRVDPGAGAPAAAEAAAKDIRALVDRGELDAAADALAKALAAAGETAPAALAEVERALDAKLAPRDHEAGLLPDAQLLADAGDAAAFDALVGASPPPRLARERDRVRRAAPAPAPTPAPSGGGLTIKGFEPDAVKVVGQRCAVEGDVDSARLEALREAVDALVPLAERLAGGTLGKRLAVRVLADDAPRAKPGPLEVVTHARPGEPVAELVDRVKLAAGRVAFAALAAGAPERAPAWLREGVPRYLAGVDAGRPSPLGRAWAREARRLPRGELVRDGAEPARSFALVRCAADGPPGCEPLARALRAALPRLAAGEAPGPFPVLDADQAGRLADACRAFLLETP